MSTLKIFVSHRNDVDSRKIDNPLFCNVRSGAVFDKFNKDPKTQGDDTGDNISDKNFKYSELTVQYWAWKNADLDYYGFCHYRRYFNFDASSRQKPDKYANINHKYIDDEVLNKIICEPDKIISKMNGCPIALTAPIDVWNIGASNIYVNYMATTILSIGDLDILLDVIHELSPEYDEVAKKYMKAHLLYSCNMFLMRKDLFFRYCEWLFPVLFECEKRIDFTNYDIEKMRVIGHLGERCLGIFYNFIKEKENIKAAFFTRVFIKNTLIGNEVLPVYNEAVTVVTASNNDYIPYLGIMIQSLLENISEQNKYEIYILHTDADAENQKKIINLSSCYSNVNIKFYDMSAEINAFSFKVSKYTEHITNETFYRTLIHKVFKNFNKVLYLDVDMIIKSDVAEIFFTDIGDNLVGACLDFDIVGNYCSNIDIKHYTDNILKLKEPMKYFQAGVILINVEQFRNSFNDRYLAEVAVKNNFRWGDQDTFNVCCQGKIFYFDPKWNVMVQHNEDRIAVIKKCPYNIYNNYIESRKEPNIIHYAGRQKPWNDPEMDFAGDFWNIARKSCFYEILLAKLANDNLLEVVKVNKLKQIRKEGKDKENLFKRIFDLFFPLETRRRNFIKRIYYKLKYKTK